jgi:hypothetical protein
MKKSRFKKEDLIELYVTEGLGAIVISEILGCTSKTIYNHLKFHGIPTRSFSESAYERQKRDKEARKYETV